MPHHQFSEREIEDLLVRYPYLMDVRFNGFRPSRQVEIPLSSGNTGIIDILLTVESTIYIIELKKGPISMAHVGQLGQYVNHYKINKKEYDIVGYIIGTSISDYIRGQVANLGYIYKELIAEIPLKIKICEKCRKATAHKNITCPYCFNSNFL
ncbi:MAG: endonuclease NucS domain-containing protein [Promethearchaeota archaeon]